MIYESKIIKKEWHHSPSHIFIPNITCIVTAGTYRKQLFFKSSDRLTLLLNTLFDCAENFNWQLEAWAVMANHYHFVAQSPDNAENLPQMIQAIHSITSKTINHFDIQFGKKVWYQYWDTCLTNEKSYYARLNYVHNNPVKHGLVNIAENYPWCSMGWFLMNADSVFRKKVFSFKYDKISIKDDF